MSNEDIPQEIFINSDSESVSYLGHCYEKSKESQFSFETVNMSNISDKFSHCSICDKTSKELTKDPITASERDVCVKILLENSEESIINVYNGDTTIASTITKENEDIFIKTEVLLERIKLGYFDTIINFGKFTYKLHLIKDGGYKYLCFYKDPFNESCSRKIGLKLSDLPEFSSQLIIRPNLISTLNSQANIDVTSNVKQALIDNKVAINGILNQYSPKMHINFFEYESDFYVVFWSSERDIDTSEILFYSIFGEEKTLVNLINLDDFDFDSILNIEDIDIYGALNSEKIKFDVDSINPDNFNFGDAVQLECSYSKIPIYESSCQQTLDDAFEDLHNQINNDFQLGKNNLYSALVTSNATYQPSGISPSHKEIYIWTPCDNSYNLDVKLSIVTPEIIVSKTSESNLHLEEVLGGYDKILKSFYFKYSVNGEVYIQYQFIESFKYQINGKNIYIPDTTIDSIYTPTPFTGTSTPLTPTQTSTPSTPTQTSTPPTPTETYTFTPITETSTSTPTTPITPTSAPVHPISPGNPIMVYWDGNSWLLNDPDYRISFGEGVYPKFKIGESSMANLTFDFKYGYYDYPIYENINGYSFKKNPLSNSFLISNGTNIFFSD